MTMIMPSPASDIWLSVSRTGYSRPPERSEVAVTKVCCLFIYYSLVFLVLPLVICKPVRKSNRKKDPCSDNKEILRSQRARCAKFEEWGLFKGKNERKGTGRERKGT